MENKKLINILIKDMYELEELISEIKKSGVFDLPELEFLQTKATGIRQLFEIFKNRNSGESPHVSELEIKPEPKVEPPVMVEETELEESENKLKDEDEAISSNIDIESEEEEIQEELDVEPVEEPIKEPELDVEEEPDFETPIPEPEVEEEHEFVATEQEPEIQEQGPIEIDTEIEESEEVELQEPVENETESHVLGERFLKEKSVNDMGFDSSLKLEHKLSRMPVGSIKSAIGINDRFLFTRELFDGNPDSFNETISALDNMNHIKEAVAYLRDNFKWKKNETSLKFVELIKRRFMND